MKALLEILASLGQYLLPQHLLSRVIYRLMRIRVRWIKNFLIRNIAAAVGVDFEEALSSNPDDYACFNDFFTRELKPQARPIDPDSRSLLCPSDGHISEAGMLRKHRIFQAKGHEYDLQSLLANDPVCSALAGGTFCTIYLSPRDYHRVHMPITGDLQRMIHIPGRLFSVAPYTVRRVPRLFARNERVVSIFDSPYGPFAQVLVGAMLVGSMSTVWAGEITPTDQRNLAVTDWSAEGIRLERGQEMGRFNMGSTVILLLPPGACERRDIWPGPGQSVRMGEKLIMLNEPGDKA